jgi:hypothetical protein
MKIFHSSDLDHPLHFIPVSPAYERTSLDECELIVHPKVLHGEKNTERLLANISAEHRDSGKKVLVFILNDFEEQYKYYPNLIIARTSARASLLRPNEIIFPYVWECRQAPFPLSANTGRPIVGFCGLVSKPRKALIKAFEKDDRVQTDFIRREKFWGGAPHNPALVEEYNQNLENTQYNVCNRGGGNFSMRFYQALSAARIPVLTDTDMHLPFADRIPWHDLIIFEKKEKDCVERTIAVHAAGECQTRQQKCREIYTQYFSLENFFERLIEEIAQKKMTSF